MSEFFRVCAGARGAVSVFLVLALLAGAYLFGIRISFNVSGSLPHRVFLTVRGDEVSCGPRSIGLFRLNVRNPYWDYGDGFCEEVCRLPGRYAQDARQGVLLKRRESGRRERA